MHDIPYVKSPLGPEIIAAMTRICSDVKKCLPASTPCGVQARSPTLNYPFNQHVKLYIYRYWLGGIRKDLQ